MVMLCCAAFGHNKNLKKIKINNEAEGGCGGGHADW